MKRVIRRAQNRRYAERVIIKQALVTPSASIARISFLMSRGTAISPVLPGRARQSRRPGKRYGEGRAPGPWERGPLDQSAQLFVLTGTSDVFPDKPGSRRVTQLLAMPPDRPPSQRLLQLRATALPDENFDASFLALYIFAPRYSSFTPSWHSYRSRTRWHKLALASLLFSIPLRFISSATDFSISRIAAARLAQRYVFGDMAHDLSHTAAPAAAKTASAAVLTLEPRERFSSEAFTCGSSNPGRGPTRGTR